MGKRVRKSSSAVRIAASQSFSTISAADASYCAAARTVDCGATVRDPEEVVDGIPPRLAGGAGLLALLVDRRRLALDQVVCAAASPLGRELQHLGVLLLGPVEGVGPLERGVAEHGPGDPRRCASAGRRLQVDHPLRHHRARAPSRRA